MPPAGAPAALGIRGRPEYHLLGGNWESTAGVVKITGGSQGSRWRLAPSDDVVPSGLARRHRVRPDRRQRLTRHARRPIDSRGGFVALASAVVLPGTVIGEHVTVAAGAVVRGVVPDRCVVAGVPAKVVRRWDAERGWVPGADDSVP